MQMRVPERLIVPSSLSNAVPALLISVGSGGWERGRRGYNEDEGEAERSKSNYKEGGSSLAAERAQKLRRKVGRGR